MTREELAAKLLRLSSQELRYRYVLPSSGLRSAVLVLFSIDQGGRPKILLTKRSENLEHHKGQIAFPGGVHEPEDLDDPRLTAVREAQEEVGLNKGELELVSVLPELSTLTGFSIRPVLAVHHYPLERIALTPLESEIAKTFWVPWQDVVVEDAFRVEHIERGGVKHPIDVFYFEEFRVWGATGMILKAIAEAWRKLAAV